MCEFSKRQTNDDVNEIKFISFFLPPPSQVCTLLFRFSLLTTMLLDTILIIMEILITIFESPLFSCRLDSKRFNARP